MHSTRPCSTLHVDLLRGMLAITVATILASLAVCNVARAATVTFLPAADSYVRSDRSTSNYGLATGLRIDASPTTNAYLRFDVVGLSGTVTTATLKVFARNSSSTPITLHPVADNLWGETTIKYANAPAIGAQVSKSGSLTSGTRVSLDAKPLVAGNGSVSMALKTTSSTVRTVDSREGVNKPQLVITTSDVPPTNGSLPTISGAAQEGQTLTADPGSWSGTPPINYAYQWRRCDGTGASCTDIAGAASKTYPLTANDVGATIRVAVRASNLAGSSTVESPVTAVVGAAAPAVLSPPAVSGTAEEGQTLTADRGTWSGTPPISYAYQWRRCDGAGASCTDIAGAASQTYVLAATDVGATVRVSVSASNTAGSATAESNATAAVVAAALASSPLPLSAPTITGTTEEGQTLTTDPGTWSGTQPITYAYQWRRCDAGGASCSDIAGAASTTYLLTTTDIGATIRVAVSASNAGGSATATSTETAVVKAPPPANLPPIASFVVIPNPAETGQAVTFDGSGSSDSDGSVTNYKWDLDGDGTFETDTGSSGTASRSYSTAESVTVKLRVTDSGGATNDASTTLTINTPAPPPPSADPVIAAAGDIACDPSTLASSSACHQGATSDLLVNQGLTAVLTLGDNQYDTGLLSAYQSVYDPSWGRVKSITYPTPGNHDPPSSGYSTYFGQPAYYSYDIGSWHLISLNSNDRGTTQLNWLKSDLAAHSNRCVLAYWHHPRFSSGTSHGSDVGMQPFWQSLYDANADVVLNGHEHNYERFARQTPSGLADPARGIREFVVGTGGRNRYLMGAPIANSEVRNSDTFGVLRLTLHSTSYDWRFVPEAGKTFTDSGSDACDETAPDTVAPTAPTSLTAAARSSARVDLSWSAATDDVGVTAYEIYRNGTLLATTSTPTTSYSDTTGSGSSAYDYQVKARDAAGNVSGGSNTASVTTLSGTAVALTFAPEADARVNEASPSTNYATSTLRADGGSDPDVESDLRFTVSGVLGTVQSAKLRLYAYTGTVDGPAAYSTDTAWSETAITWANRPLRTSAATDDKGAIAVNSWVEYNVTNLVTGDGTYSFVLATTSSDGVDFYSREAASLRPELFVTAG